MKKAVLASAVVAAFVSGSALAAEVYNSDGTSLKIGGRAEFRGDFIGSGGAEVEGTMANKSRVRLNVGGETAITSDLSGFGFYEAEQSANSSGDNSRDVNGSEFKQRYLLAGLKGSFGSVSFGRQDTAAVQISQMSDISTFSGAQKEFINAGNEQINNTILYTYGTDALSLKASAIFGEDEDTNGYGVSGIYTLPMGLGLGLGYSANDAGSDSEDAIIAGVNFSMDSLYVAATYTLGTYSADSGLGATKEQDFSGIEASAEYKFTKQFSLIGAYQKTELDNFLGQSEDATDWFEITGTYKFNSNIRAYASYLLNNLDDAPDANGVEQQSEDTLRLGLRYDF